jgi:hypothetical protein
MKTTSGSLNVNGLLSSLLLNVGFARIAEKLDPVSTAFVSDGNIGRPAEPCIHICNWQQRANES